MARDGLAEVVATLGLICGSLAKIATDIILLCQTEIGEVSEPYVAGRGSSSTMPQKRNPIASEYVLAAQRGVRVALAEGDTETAARELQAISTEIPVVRDEEGQPLLRQEQEFLAAKLAETPPGTPADLSTPPLLPRSSAS